MVEIAGQVALQTRRAHTRQMDSGDARNAKGRQPTAVATTSPCLPITAARIARQKQLV